MKRLAPNHIPEHKNVLDGPFKLNGSILSPMSCSSQRNLNELEIYEKINFLRFDMIYIITVHLIIIASSTVDACDMWQILFFILALYIYVIAICLQKPS